MIQRIFYGILILTAALIGGYLLQPLKKGKGLNPVTQYVQVQGWPNLPVNFQLGNPVGIGMDTAQNIVVFHRAERKWPLLGPMPATPIKGNTILIIDRKNGKLVNSWGANQFIMPHGLTVDAHNNVWVTDVGLHQVFKFDAAGKLLMQLGVPKMAGNDRTHFNMPTDIAVATDGSFYVSDGYGNSRIMKFSPEGRFLFEWGKKGSEAGLFNIPHALCLDQKGNVLVADRENNRIQVFDAQGKFVRQWTDAGFGSITSVCCSPVTTKIFAADDLSFLKIKHRGSDLLIMDTTGNVQTRFGRSGFYSGSATWYHDLVVDKEENFFVGDILKNRIQKFTKVATE